MPNYVRNVIEMEGIGKAEELFSVIDGERCFDFNKLVRMPESIRNTDWSGSDVGRDAVRFTINRLAASRRKFMYGSYREDIFGKVGSFEKTIALTDDKPYSGSPYSEKVLFKRGMQYLYNLTMYGWSNWYEWAYANWGTKWNAMDTRVISNDEVQFDTAWCGVPPIIELLRKKYPDKSILYTFADEDCGSNADHMEYDALNDGGHVNYWNVQDGTSEAYECYIKCWGPDPCIHKGTDGKYYFDAGCEE